MLNKEFRFKLFANCIPVKGANRSVICDIQREDYELIPNSLYDILKADDDFSFDEYVAKYGEEYRETLMEYFNFLVHKEFGFWTDTPEKFPSMNMEWEYPYPVFNAIVDWNSQSNYDMGKVIQQLDKLGCKHVQFRFFDELPLEEVTNYLLPTVDSRLSSMELYLKHQPEYTLEVLNDFLYENRRVEALVLHSAPEDKLDVERDDMPNLRGVHIVKQKIDSEAHCGKIHPNYFSMNTSAFTEALQFNSCLNRKISVDTQGRIKNCPSMTTDYGSVEDTTLKTALNTPGFKAVWSVTKDSIKVCQDCEFRYICTDCRAYTVDGVKDGKPAKCGYDPYTNIWKKTNDLE